MKVWFFIYAAAVTCSESRDVETVGVAEGSSVILRTCLTKLNPAAVIKWGFGTPVELIAWKRNEISLVNFDKRFKSRLQLDTQTGCLTISNITIINSGLYTLLINETNAYKRFNVTVQAPGSVLTTRNITLVSECPIPDGFLSAVSPAQASGVSSVHCCGSVEVVIQLFSTPLVSLVAVFLLNYHFK